MWWWNGCFFFFLRSCQFGKISFSLSINFIQFDMVSTKYQSEVFLWLHGTLWKCASQESPSSGLKYVFFFFLLQWYRLSAYFHMFHMFVFSERRILQWLIRLFSHERIPSYCSADEHNYEIRSSVSIFSELPICERMHLGNDGYLLCSWVGWEDWYHCLFIWAWRRQWA